MALSVRDYDVRRRHNQLQVECSRLAVRNFYRLRSLGSCDREIDFHSRQGWVSAFLSSAIPCRQTLCDEPKPR